MRKLEKIRLHQFQKHTIKTIAFGEGVTSIVGKTGAGKSSIIRAIRWTCLNKPQGNVLIRKGRSKATVRLWMNQMEVLRTKGKNSNLYKLDGEEYRSFGTKPPQDVADAVGLEEINFQLQHDPLFWISLSPGQLLKEINKITDLSLMDSILQLINRRKRKNTSEMEVRKESLSEIRTEIRSLRKVVSMESTIAEFESKLDRIQEISVRLSAVKKSYKRVKGTSETIERIRDEIRRQERADLRGKIERFEEIRSKLLNLEEKVAKIHNLKKKVMRSRTLVKSLSIKFNRKLRKSICPICGRSPK